MNTPNLEPLAAMLGAEASPKIFAQVLDDACFNIAQMGMQHRDNGTYGEPEVQIYYLRMLRDAMTAAEPKGKK
jgi:hypothetical protein